METQKVKVNINGVDYMVEAGLNILEACKSVGVEIPFFCYHPSLKVAGSCRMCLIQMGTPARDRATGEPVLDENGVQKIAWMPKPVIACGTNVSEGMHIITDNEMIGVHKRTSTSKTKKNKKGKKIESFLELNIGDYVVHENHGLGIYKGIEKVEVEKVVKDYIKIEYRDGGNLYILATGLDVIQKYASADAKKPKLNKLGTQEWNKTKTKVRGAVSEVAKDLVELYAIRQQKEGFSYGRDTVWQREFEEMFPFEETEDQLNAIEATKKDMESTKIMDRLICGDVGYGKTEIAIRAAFKAVQENKQVVFLVPTTILAQQHYNTFTQRMKEFPVRVDLLSRFRTASEQKKTIQDLKKGLVDIVIGTHRVLSKDVEYKDLGLLIID